jgi:hypothetical protein
MMIHEWTAVEPGAKPSAHGRSEIFPAMNRLLTPEGNVRAMAANPGMEPPHRASPLNRLFSSSSFPHPLALIRLLAESGKVWKNRMSHKKERFDLFVNLMSQFVISSWRSLRHCPILPYTPGTRCYTGTRRQATPIPSPILRHGSPDEPGFPTDY